MINFLFCTVLPMGASKVDPSPIHHAPLHPPDLGKQLQVLPHSDGRPQNVVLRAVAQPVKAGSVHAGHALSAHPNLWEHVSTFLNFI